MSFATANAALLDLMYSRKHDPAAGAELEEAHRRLAARGAELIEAGQRDGEVREGSVELLALPLAATIQGLTALALSGAFSAQQIDEGLAETVTLLRRGYAP